MTEPKNKIKEIIEKAGINVKELQNAARQGILRKRITDNRTAPGTSLVATVLVNSDFNGDSLGLLEAAAVIEGTRRLRNQAHHDALIKTRVLGLLRWPEESIKISKATDSWCHELPPLYLMGRIWDHSALGFTDPSIRESIDALNTSQVFIVENDWAYAMFDALGGAKHEYKLPYPQTVFEFKVHNGFVMAVAQQEDGEGIRLGVFAVLPDEQGGPAAVYQSVDFNKPADWQFIVDQIKGICVALDVEIAERGPVEPRRIHGRQAVPESVRPRICFHTLKLSKKYDTLRTRSKDTEGKQGRFVRLHFRRGHWRICESGKKVWVRYCMVGYRELGFSDKFYLI